MNSLNVDEQQVYSYYGFGNASAEVTRGLKPTIIQTKSDPVPNYVGGLKQTDNPDYNFTVLSNREYLPGMGFSNHHSQHLYMQHPEFRSILKLGPILGPVYNNELQKGSPMLDLGYSSAFFRF